MADESVHIAQANRNQELLGRLVADIHPLSEWIATVAFYKALHIVEAVFDQEEPIATRHSGSHRERNDILRERYPHIWSHYFNLHAASMIGRYLESPHLGSRYSTFGDFLSDEQVRSLILAVDLVGVETEAAPYLSAGNPLIFYRP